MKRYPNLRGRYQGSVFSPLQWGMLAGVGFIIVMGHQIDTLLHTAFRIELFDHEVVRVEPEPRPTRTPRGVQLHGLRPVLDVTPLDWPAPPIQTDWMPSQAYEGEIDIEIDIEEITP